MGPSRGKDTVRIVTHLHNSQDWITCAFTTERCAKQPLAVRGPGAGAEVTVNGVFYDISRFASCLGAPSIFFYCKPVFCFSEYQVSDFRSFCSLSLFVKCMYFGDVYQSNAQMKRVSMVEAFVTLITNLLVTLNELD
ncbi:hypothetical protein RND71_016069 [Anisodus tanguticus]|uniref:Uncharacterized protein n=1 Tax=Anisodus tanguticus TaxID=243964 RepID=A0AAE1S7G8_9SOLA|nr:hypothetical protein RND71_016069 [Anisodus tanguticus]